jgi:hypothetical protein
MKPTPLLLATLIGWVVPAQAADLSKVDCTIAREPAYQARPAYCLLVFGPEAKTRVWLVLDGDTLYADRNANGDLTNKGERFDLIQDEYDRKRGKRLWEVGDVGAPDGKVTYTGLQVWDLARCDGSGLLLVDDRTEPAVQLLAKRAGTTVTLAERGKEKKVIRP